MSTTTARMPIAASGVPITAQATRELVQVITALVDVRPANWQDSQDPQQRAAWQAADVVLAKHGVR
ncbi:hypothetical protein [Sphingomonas melonis]|uniref:hypothetical protein n=1 Tax=Sphingomonas melonis TaxID=152682 RepID=UPI00036A475B|nr:hypothetical protein [Sphingomonas melonis]